MIKLADTLEPMADFPSAYAKDIAFNDGDTLQEKLDTGSLGGGVGYKQLSQAEYDALTDDEKMDGREYRTYDTGHIYKLGIEYGKDACFTSLSQLGLTAPTTVGEVFIAMPNKSMIMLNVEADETLQTVTDTPEEYGVLTIDKWSNSRFRIEFNTSREGISTNVKQWIGTLKGTDGTGLKWKEVATMDKVNASLGELCNKKIYCGEFTGTTVDGFIGIKNPIGKPGNVIATMKYTNSTPYGYSVTAQTTLSELNFYFRWHREGDDAEAYPPDGTEITISYMIFY